MAAQRLMFSFKKDYRPGYMAIPKIEFGKECICCNKKTNSTYGFQTYGGSGSTYTPEPIPAPLCDDCQDHVHPDHISFFVAFGMMLSFFIGMGGFIPGIIYFSPFGIILGLSFLSVFSILYWYFYRRPVKNAPEGHFPLTRFIVYQNNFGVVSKNAGLIQRLQDLNRRVDLEVKQKEISPWF